MSLPRVEEVAGATLNYDPRNPGATISYVVWRSDVEADVRAALLAKAPAVFGGMPLLNVVPTEDKQAPGFWTATATYGMADSQPGVNPASPLPPPPPGVPPPPAPPPAPAEDDALGTQHRFQWAYPGGRFTQAKSQDRYYPAGASVPTFSRAINVQPDGDVDGVELPSWPEAVTVVMTVPNFTIKYYKSCRRLAGKRNDAAFGGHLAGELLYLGGSAEPREGGSFTVTHRFAEEEQQTIPADALVTGVSSITVAPFSYVWVWYKAGTDANRTVKVPAMVCVARLYDAADFTPLGLYT